MKKQLTIFLDLEETLIDDWFTGNWLPEQADDILACINSRIVDIQPDEITLL